jgi:hypothetical protein
LDNQNATADAPAYPLPMICRFRGAMANSNFEFQDARKRPWVPGALR